MEKGIKPEVGSLWKSVGAICVIYRVSANKKRPITGVPYVEYESTIQHEDVQKRRIIRSTMDLEEGPGLLVPHKEKKKDKPKKGTKKKGDKKK